MGRRFAPMGVGLVCCWWTALSALAATPDAPARIVRKPWTTSRVIGSPEEQLPYRAVRLYEHLKIEQPLYAAQVPGTRELLVVELQRGKDPGKVHRFADDPAVKNFETLLTIDRLIYGLTFHPRFTENGYLYLITNGPSSAEKKFNRISRFTVPKAPETPVDPATELVILEWESNGHNGGELGFGPDGMLYCPTGDGTSDSDPLETGQGVNDLLSVMLRLDVDHPTEQQPYSIPSDNPFLDVPGARGEIWAFGFRNPWRMTFDREKGHLWVTQNGQDLWEQVYLIRKGENYGWSVQEGSQPFYLNRPTGPGQITPPTAEHHHIEARSLTGGVVYYGDKLPELRGAYIYGDYSTGRVWGLRHDGDKVTWHEELVDTPYAIVGFAETPAGELVLIDQHSGFYRLEPAPPQQSSQTFPQQLSETGLFKDVRTLEVAEGVVPYSVNSPLWSDGAYKERWLALPGWQQIDFTSTKAWQLPEGTVLVKHFSLEQEPGRAESRRRVETRLLTRQQNEWVGYSYAWNEAETDAILVESKGRDQVFTIRDAAAEGGVREQTWHYPSRTECMVCHSRAAGFVLGLQTEQMNRVQPYPEGEFNQLDYLSRGGYLRTKLGDHTGAAEQWKQLAGAVESQLVPFSTQVFAAVPAWLTSRLVSTGAKLREPPAHLPWLPKAPAEYAAFPHPYASEAPLEARVRSYLHVNCSVCHQMAGGGNAQIDLLFHTELEKTKVVDVVPNHDRLGLAEARIIAPGDPDRSVLLQRILRRGRGQMPPLATGVADREGAALLEAWIRDLQPLPAKTETKASE